jgi:hypothetical protein
MECYYHPSRESTDNCAICGKSICKECGLEIAGKIYCKECLEKIVGVNLESTQEEPAVEQQPISLERQESPEEQIGMANVTREAPQRVQPSNQRIADDSPYNIKNSIQYEGGLESGYEDTYSPRSPQRPEEEYNNPIVPERPVEDVRQEYVNQDDFMNEVVQEPIQQARNEYDYSPSRPQAPPADEYIYPDHSYQPGETSARQAVEDKYERYLDDLYFDEEEIPLDEQLARDEEQYGSLTRHERPPRNARPQQQTSDDDLDRRIREELARRDQGRRQPSRESFHNINYEEEKEPFGAVDILLTIILIIVILIVILYIVYLFKLNATYPTFIDALLGITNPGKFFHALF